VVVAIPMEAMVAAAAAMSTASLKEVTAAAVVMEVDKAVIA